VYTPLVILKTKIKNLKRYSRLFLALLPLLLAPSFAKADILPLAPSLIISEIKIRNDTNGYDEFIELFNPGTLPAPLSQYFVEYFNTSNASATSTVHTKAAVGSDGYLEPNKFFVLAKQIGQITDSQKSPFTNLADGGGTVRVLATDGNILDGVSWVSNSTISTESLGRQADANGLPLAGDAVWTKQTPTPHSDTILASLPPEILPPAEPTLPLAPIPVAEDSPTPPPPVIEESPTPPITDATSSSSNDVPAETPSTSVPPSETQPVVDAATITPPTDEGTVANTQDLPQELILEITPQLPPAQEQLAIPLQITELLPDPVAPATDANDEFAELFNPNAFPVNLNGYKLETGTTYSYSYTFGDVIIPANDYLVVYSRDTHLTLANNGGRARLLAPGPNLSAISETAPYGTALAGKTWALVDNVWQWDANVTPGAANTLPPPDNADDVLGGSITGGDLQGGGVPTADNTATRYLPLNVTELLPNPAPPATDDADEYVEIYNPNTEPVDLEGYKVQTGKSYSYTYIFGGGSIAPGAYLVLYSSESNLTLANTGGKARVLDPAGVTVSETDPYDGAADGATWSYIDNTWEWTTTATPGAANMFTAKLAASKKATTKTAAKPKAKVAAAKTSKKTNKPGSGAGSSAFGNEAAQPSVLHPLIIAVIGGAALLYGAYEYRTDVANFVYKLRRNRKTRRAAGQTAFGGRSN
jgi:hypothetical protein